MTIGSPWAWGQECTEEANCFASKDCGAAGKVWGEFQAHPLGKVAGGGVKVLCFSLVSSVVSRIRFDNGMLQGPLTRGPRSPRPPRGRMDLLPSPFGERVARIRRNRQPGRAG